jgi:hypothetical protein
VGEAGTYEVGGNILTMRPLASKNPAAMVPGAFIVYTYRLDSNTVWFTQQRNQNGPYPSPATFKPSSRPTPTTPYCGSAWSRTAICAS